MSATSQDGIYKAGLKHYSLPSIQFLFSKKTWAIVFSSLLLILFGSAARGEFVLFLVMLWKNWDEFKFFPFPSLSKNENHPIENHGLDNITESPMNALDEFLKPYHFQQFYIHVIFGLLVSYAMFFLIGGYLQW